MVVLRLFSSFYLFQVINRSYIHWKEASGSWFNVMRDSQFIVILFKTLSNSFSERIRYGMSEKLRNLSEIRKLIQMILCDLRRVQVFNVMMLIFRILSGTGFKLFFQHWEASYRVRIWALFQTQGIPVQFLDVAKADGEVLPLPQDITKIHIHDIQQEALCC